MREDVSHFFLDFLVCNVLLLFFPFFSLTKSWTICTRRVRDTQRVIACLSCNLITQHNDNYLVSLPRLLSSWCFFFFLWYYSVILFWSLVSLIISSLSQLFLSSWQSLFLEQWPLTDTGSCILHSTILTGHTSLPSYPWFSASLLPWSSCQRHERLEEEGRRCTTWSTTFSPGLDSPPCLNVTTLDLLLISYMHVDPENAWRHEIVGYFTLFLSHLICVSALNPNGHHPLRYYLSTLLSSLVSVVIHLLSRLNLTDTCHVWTRETRQFLELMFSFIPAFLKVLCMTSECCRFPLLVILKDGQTRLTMQDRIAWDIIVIPVSLFVRLHAHRESVDRKEKGVKQDCNTCRCLLLILSRLHVISN